MNTTDKLREKMVKAEKALDDATDNGAPRPELRRKEKAMHKAQSAYFAATGKAETTRS